MMLQNQELLTNHTLTGVQGNSGGHGPPEGRMTMGIYPEYWMVGWLSNSGL